jgi:hypothetical protein
MKTKQILLGVMASAALCGTSALAQISYQNGDMLAGFRNGGNVELIVDLGSIANFQTPYYTQTYAGVSSAITSIFGSTTGLYWSVFGANDTTTTPYNHAVSQADPNTFWNTLARSNPNLRTSAPFVAGSSSSQALAVGDVGSIGGLTSPSTPGVTNIALNIVEVNTSLGGYSSLMADPNSGNLGGNWSYNIENLGAGSSDLYQSNPGNHFTQKATYLGDFTLSSGGALSFNAVPEPSTWTMLGAGVLSLLTFGRFRRNN